MFRLVLLVGVAVACGCGDPKPPAVPTDPESVKKLEALQKQAAGGEGKKGG